MYWRNQLLSKCMRIFEWNGLPNYLPQKEIEIRLIFRGFAGFIKHNGKLFVTYGEMSGVTEYADEFKIYTFANPVFSGVKRIGEDCVIIEVSDNGLGFDVDSYNLDKEVHIGINNVRERIKSMANGSFVISSIINEGTKAIITLPKKDINK